MKFGSVPGVHKPVSRLVHGTILASSKELAHTFDLLDQALAVGCNAFDTARCYGGGDNEVAVGKWVNERGVRDSVVIIGKGAHPTNRNRVTPTDIDADISESLRCFGFDYIDLYLLHRDDPSVPVGPIVEALNEQLLAGRIHAFGGSNWSHERVRLANEYARAHGLAPFVASSPNLSLAIQRKAPWNGCISISGPAGKPARDWYAAADLALFAWSSLAGGFFSGRVRRDNLESFETYLDKLCVEVYATDDNFRRLDRVQTLALEKGLSIPQVALAWVLNQPLNLFALVAPASQKECQDNLRALEVKLSPAELSWLDLSTDSR